MKNLLAIIFCISFLSIQAQTDGFVGVIKAASSSPEGLAGEFLVKGKKVAQKNPKNAKADMVLLIDNEKHEYYELKTVAGKKVAMKYPKPAVSAFGGKMVNSMEKAVKSALTIGNGHDIEKQAAARIKNVVVTGETKKIGDYTCTKVTAKDDQTKVVAWITKEIPLNYLDLVKNPQKLYLLANMTNKYAGVKGLIMEMSVKNLSKGTSVTTNLEVTAKKVKNKKFKIPESYTVMDMSNTKRGNKVPSTKSMKSVTDRAYEMQNKVREQQKKDAMKKEQAPSPEAAPKAAPVKTEQKG